jgi:hypothetical protein
MLHMRTLRFLIMTQFAQLLCNTGRVLKAVDSCAPLCTLVTLFVSEAAVAAVAAHSCGDCDASVACVCNVRHIVNTWLIGTNPDAVDAQSSDSRSTCSPDDEAAPQESFAVFDDDHALPASIQVRFAHTPFCCHRVPKFSPYGSVCCACV